MSRQLRNLSGQRNHALLLDDDEGARNLLSRIAAEAGYEVSLASKCEEFILQFALNKPTFLILDVFLGNENIRSIFRFLRSQRFAEPVALVSGYAVREMDLLVADAMASGILIIGLFEKTSVTTVLRKHLDIYHRGAGIA